MQSLSIGELVVRGVEIRAFEAVAIARALIDALPDEVDPAMAPGPPSLSTVRLSANGTVSCCSCGITPSTDEVAILLSDILRQSRIRAGGGLQYAIARALLQVDAPPFESVSDFSSALRRYEEGASPEVLRALWRRAIVLQPRSATSVYRGPDRRRRMPPATELRRQLRDADEAIYELLTAQSAAPEPLPARLPFLRWRNRTAWTGLAVVAAAGLVMIPSFRSGTDNRDAVTLPTSPSSVERPVAAPTDRQILPFDHRSEAVPATTSDLAPRKTRPSHDAGDTRSTARGVADNVPVADDVPMEEAPVRALDHDVPMFPPSFAFDGTAMFVDTGRPPDAQRASMRRDVGGKPVAEDLRIVTIADDGAKNYHARPSPDGTRIAFDSDRDGERGVYVVESDGTRVRRVSGPGSAAAPTWSPNGDRLSFVRNEPNHPNVWNLWIHSFSSGEAERVTSFQFGQTWGASWFPDGRRICYAHEDRLFVHDLQTGRSRQYPSPVAGRLIRTPAVSPDGEQVIFQVAPHGAWLLDLTDGSMRVVLTDPTAEEFAWSPDGRRVAFHSKRDGGWGIWFTAGS